MKLTICESPVFSNVGEDSDAVTGPVSEIVKELGGTLLPIGVFAERINDPNLAEADGRGKCCSFRVPGDEFYVLNALALRDLG